VDDGVSARGEGKPAGDDEGEAAYALWWLTESDCSSTDGCGGCGCGCSVTV
jgi:hypothetical protein